MARLRRSVQRRSDAEESATIYAFADDEGVFYVGKRRGSQRERESAGYNIAVWERRKRKKYECLTLAIVPVWEDGIAEQKWRQFFASVGSPLLNVVDTPRVRKRPDAWYSGLDVKAARQRALDDGCTLSREGNYIRPPPSNPEDEDWGEPDRLPGVEPDEPWSDVERDELLAEMRHANSHLSEDDFDEFIDG